MRTLFSMEMDDYDESWTHIARPSVRGIIIRNGKIAMVESRLWHYWKFPGGGIEGNDSHLETLRREVREEAGLIIKEDTVREYGFVPRKEASTVDPGTWFDQDNFYYMCEAEEEGVPQELDEYENEESFTLSWIDPRVAIRDNREKDHGKKAPNMIEREARVLEMLIEEGCFD